MTRKETFNKLSWLKSKINKEFVCPSDVYRFYSYSKSYFKKWKVKIGLKPSLHFSVSRFAHT